MHGLQWALYGEAALPGKGEGFRLHPIDWEASEGKRVPITATVEFELMTYRRTSGEVRETRRRYRLVRSAFEDVDSQSRRSASTVKLFELTDTGTKPYPSPESKINDELPSELRDVFFTDGDRALELHRSGCRAVHEARTGATRHSLASRAWRDRQRDQACAQIGGGSEQEGEAGRQRQRAEQNRLASRSDGRRPGKLDTDLEDAKQQFGAFDEKVDEIDRKIAAALQKGDKEKLRKDLDHAKREIKQLDNQLAAANKEHSALFRSRSIATDLLAPVLARAFEKLEELHDQGKIPNTTIPVLQDRLAAEICICGETLEAGDAGGAKRRAHIQKLIDDSQRADEIQEIITDLYYGARPLQGGADAGPSVWLEDYRKVVERRDGIQTLRDEAGRKFRALEMQLDSLPNTDIQGLRETRRQYKDQRDRHLSKQSALDTQLTGLRREREELEVERDQLLREQKKGARILAELEVTQDVMKVLQSAYERLTNEELQKVSDLMNSIFLEMIGRTPEQGAIIRRAEISREFDIIVYGPNDRSLNPDRDLNGASRRALTLAFILALTKVSEVEAPNVIDTPLGMTSGFVKRSILRTAVRESAQLILFLTHDEIAGCEEIIDEAAGVVFTLSNPAHYPRMLVNDPGITERKVLRCACDHRDECQLCLRHEDAQVELEAAS